MTIRSTSGSRLHLWRRLLSVDPAVPVSFEAVGRLFPELVEGEASEVDSLVHPEPERCTAGAEADGHAAPFEGDARTREESALEFHVLRLARRAAQEPLERIRAEDREAVVRYLRHVWSRYAEKGEHDAAARVQVVADPLLTRWGYYALVYRDHEARGMRMSPDMLVGQSHALATALHDKGETAAASREIDELQKRARRSSRPDAEAAASLLRAYSLLAQGDLDSATRLAHDTAERASGIGNRSLERKATFLLARLHSEREEYDAALMAYRAVLEDAEDLWGWKGNLPCLMGVALCLRATGRTTDAIQHYGWLLAEVGATGHALLQVQCRNNLAYALTARGDHAEAFRHLDLAMQQAEERGIRAVQCAILHTRAELCINAGRNEEALRLVAEGLERASVEEDPLSVRMLRNAAARAHLMRERWPEAREMAEAAVAVPVALEEDVSLTLLGLAALRSGQPQAAVASFQRAVERCDRLLGKCAANHRALYMRALSLTGIGCVSGGLARAVAAFRFAWAMNRDEGTVLAVINLLGVVPLDEAELRRVRRVLWAGIGCEELILRGALAFARAIGAADVPLILSDFSGQVPAGVDLRGSPLEVWGRVLRWVLQVGQLPGLLEFLVDERRCPCPIPRDLRRTIEDLWWYFAESRGVLTIAAR